MPDSIDWALVDRYLAGELGEAESAQVRRWLMAHPDANTLFGTIGTALDGEPAAGSAPASTLGTITDDDARRSWAVVAARFATPDHAPAAPSAPAASGATPRPRMARAPIPARRWLTVATGAVLAATAGWLLTLRTEMAPATPGRVYATGAGQHASFTLADGSTVLLADASTVSVPADFGVATRTVTVRGEAYFTVKHATGIPFIVRTGATTTRVLGTAFSARRYDGDSVTRVVVAEGRVALGSAVRSVGAKVVVPARTMAEVTDSGRIAVTPNIALDETLDWTRGRLVFRNTPIRDAIPRLERRYGVRIQLADTTLVTETFTSTFINEPLTQVLDVLAVAFGATYARSGPDGHVITFTPDHRAVRRRTPSNRLPALLPEVSYGK